MNYVEQIRQLKDNMNLIEMLLYIEVDEEDIRQLFNLLRAEAEPLQIILSEMINQPDDEKKIEIFRKYLPSYTVLKQKLCKKEVEIFDKLSTSLP